MDVKIHTEPPAKVYLLGMGAAETILATVTRGYSQVYEAQITKDELEKFLDDLGKTKLQTPNAFITMSWLIRNVTRNFEQQLTRYRVGTAFVCESLRFSDKRQAEFYCKAKTSAGRTQFSIACKTAIEKYEVMLKYGEATQDARDVLPGSICTHLFFSCNLQTLAHIYAQRSCCQAQQEEWSAVIAQMVKLLEKQSPALRKFLKAPWEDPDCINCGFGASFDRSCQRQELFDANLSSAVLKRQETLNQAKYNPLHNIKWHDEAHALPSGSESGKD